MSPENLAPALQKLEPSEPRLEPSKSQSKGNEVANGLNGNFEPQQALVLINAIKADLKQTGLTKPETQEKVLQLEKWAQGLPTGNNVEKQATALKKTGKPKRHCLQTFASKLVPYRILETFLKRI